MIRFLRGWGVLGLAAVAVALAPGCQSQPSTDGGGPTPAEIEAAKRVQALQPFNKAHEVSRRPTFRWRLPTDMTHPDFVTFKLFEVGPALPEPPASAPEAETRDPLLPAAGEIELASVTNLASASPTELELFNPPASSTRVGDLWSKKVTQLKANTWYHWKVHAVDASQRVLADFYFMTGSVEALAPRFAGDETDLSIEVPPLPQPLPPQPPEKAPPRAPK